MCINKHVHTYTQTYMYTYLHWPDSLTYIFIYNEEEVMMDREFHFVLSKTEEISVTSGLLVWLQYFEILRFQFD